MAGVSALRCFDNAALREKHARSADSGAAGAALGDDTLVTCFDCDLVDWRLVSGPGREDSHLGYSVHQMSQVDQAHRQLLNLVPDSASFFLFL